MQIYIQWKNPRNDLVPSLLRRLTEQLGWFVSDRLDKSAWVAVPEGESLPETVPRDRILRLSGKELEEVRAETAFCRDEDAPPQEAEFAPKDRTPWLDQLAREWQQSVQEEVFARQGIFLRKLPWPEGKLFAFTISHDVDLTRAYGPKTLLRFLLEGRLKELERGIARMGGEQDPYWTFPQLQEQYRDLGWKATFFFLARAREDWSYRYNVRSRRFRKLLDELLAGGHEIGLHSSKYAFEQPARLRQEKAVLEAVLGRPVAGVRQHFLRLRFPEAWERFAREEFRYDASCGFNHRLGFRAGTSFPFQPPMKSRKNFWEIPFALMDYPWISGKSPEESWQNFAQIAREVESVGGMLQLLWHPSNLAEAVFRPSWNRLMEWAEGKSFYQNHLEGLLRWWEARQQVRLVEQRIEARWAVFVLESDFSLEGFALELLGRKKIRVKGNDLRQEETAPGVYRLMIPRLPSGRFTLTVEF